MPEARPQPEALYFDSHMHTELCKHAHGTPDDYAAIGREMNLRGIIITCHCPMPDGFWPEVRMAPEEFDEYVALVEGAAASAGDGIEIKLGIESDFFPGTERWIEELHARAEFHHCLGSVHYFGPEYTARYWHGDVEGLQTLYFDHLAASAETGLFDTLAHPDLIKNLSPDHWRFGKLRPVVAAALDRIAATGVAMELNTSGVYKRYPEMNPGPLMLEMMAERGIPVVLGSDSHNPLRVGEGFADALDSLEAAGYHEVSYFDRRRRIDLPIAAVRVSLEG